MWDDIKRLHEYHGEVPVEVRILKLTECSVTQAAKLARRNRTEFYKLLQRHGIEAAIFKSTVK